MLYETYKKNRLKARKEIPQDLIIKEDRVKLNSMNIKNGLIKENMKKNHITRYMLARKLDVSLGAINTILNSTLSENVYRDVFVAVNELIIEAKLNLKD